MSGFPKNCLCSLLSMGGAHGGGGGKQHMELHWQLLSEANCAGYSPSWNSWSFYLCVFSKWSLVGRGAVHMCRGGVLDPMPTHVDTVPCAGRTAPILVPHWDPQLCSWLPCIDLFFHVPPVFASGLIKDNPPSPFLTYYSEPPVPIS